MLSALITFAAVLALVGLNWWLAGSGRLARDPGGASARLRDDLIDFVERDGDDANAGRAHVALGAAPDDLAVAVARGDGWVTRRLRPGTLRGVTRDGTRLDLRCRDFTLPNIVLIFADAERAGRWESRFGALLRGGTDGSA
jgi:hypothetical protein